MHRAKSAVFLKIILLVRFKQSINLVDYNIKFFSYHFNTKE